MVNPIERWLGRMLEYAKKHNFYSVEEIVRLKSAVDLYSDLEPADFFKLLERRGVDVDELKELRRNVRFRRVKDKTKPFDLVGFEDAVGKSVVMVGDIWAFGHRADMVVKAVRGLKGKAKSLWNSEVKKVRLSSKSRPEGRWLGNGVMELSLGTDYPAGVYEVVIVHELGHAFEDKLGLILTTWDDSPYGKSPFFYVEETATEDFAETFQLFLMSPSALKRRTPEKYYDMKERI